ncbi:MAG: hypothetical protein H9W81_07960 [Enterococcus sp.]|nr:hypothetical protein [Enterococcus sp.]
MDKSDSILIHGTSDDRVTISGMIEEEYDLGFEKWQAKIIDSEGNYLLVVADYRGEWEVSVSAPSDSGFPEWPVSFEERPYDTGDPAVRIWIPEDAVIHLVYSSH